MKKLFTLVFGLWLFQSLPASAGDPVVIELFTSQGCDMCPPAHVLQEEYANMTDAIPLTWNVEVWDFMGWRDTYARPEFSKRQYDYNQNFGRKGVYTPQAVINGRQQVVASKKLELYTGIKNALNGNETPVSVRFLTETGPLRVSVAGDRVATKTNIFLLWVKLEGTVKVTSGNNIGKTLSYMNIVRHFDVIGQLKNTGQIFTVNLSDPNRGDADAVAVLVQEGEVGRILGAGFYRLNGS